MPGHHIDDEERFQSDRHPELPPDKVVVSFKDPRAHNALAVLAMGYAKDDPEFAKDILFRLMAIKLNYVPKKD